MLSVIIAIYVKLGRENFLRRPLRPELNAGFTWFTAFNVILSVTLAATILKKLNLSVPTVFSAITSLTFLDLILLAIAWPGLTVCSALASLRRRFSCLAWMRHPILNKAYFLKIILVSVLRGFLNRSEYSRRPWRLKFLLLLLSVFSASTKTAFYSNFSHFVFKLHTLTEGGGL